jgi:hypothetical protein
MKKVFLLAKAVIVILLFANQYSYAQTLCRSSFKFVATDHQKVAINAIGSANTSELYDSAQGFTWEAWINLTDTITSDSNKGHVLIAAEDGTTNEDIWLGTGFDGTGAQLNFRVRTKGSYASPLGNYVTSTKHLLPNKWYYVTGICDYVKKKLIVVVDGTWVDTAGITFDSSERLTRNITTSIGNYNSTDKYSLNGYIDEVKFWRGVRSTTDILFDSAGCDPMPQTNLLAYFKANEGTGTSTISVIDTRFNGTNTAQWGANAPVSICQEPTATITSVSDSICYGQSATITVKVSNLRPGEAWSVTLSDGTVISGVADGAGAGSGSVTLYPSTTTTYVIASFTYHQCATVSGSTTITVNTYFSIPRTACLGDKSTFSVSFNSKCAACVDLSTITWKITDSASTVIATLFGSSVAYIIPYTGHFTVCVSWKDKCEGTWITYCDSITVTDCCKPEILMPPTTACTGSKGEFSFSPNKGCPCNQSLSYKWAVTDPSGGVSIYYGTTVSYTYASSGVYTICLSWTNSCTNITNQDCQTVNVETCCTCDMKLTPTSSTTNLGAGDINGQFHLNSGSKKVVGVEMSILYFDYTVPDGCNLDCKLFHHGSTLGNFIKNNALQGVTSIFPGCLNPNKTSAREVDWNYSAPVTIDDNISYMISIPVTSCDVTYDYCIKVLLHYDDCTSCECTFCVHADRITCGCNTGEGGPGGSFGKAAHNSPDTLTVANSL